jgi:putative hydrolase of the HAD superfamily
VTFPRAVLLDLDDTILDDSGDSDRCWSEACAAHRHGTLEPSRVHDAIQRVRAWYWSHPDRHREGRLRLKDARRAVVAKALADLGVTDADLAGNIASTYGELRRAAIRPFDGAVETVLWLRQLDLGLALITNGDALDQRDKIERFGLAGLFDIVLIEGELGFGKPDPRVYRQALSGLGVAPAEAWMVGDNLEWEVAAPKRLGLTCVWVDRHGRGLPPDFDPAPDRVIHRLPELRECLPRG